MKPKKILSGLTILWVLVVILEGVSSMIRSLYARKMGRAARSVSGAVGAGKAALLVALAVSNVFLFMRHVDEQ